ncbi:MAG: protein-L-isoaspartate O-methyltransferase [Hoeflea sp.]|uniref:protein-L-isoaspartate O-methyltransferase family protein n=1 Tax=Hoeflea sp. TaxID=1940281 RepID=UPI001E1A547C|nr:protein-L-isoaspartate O-methyltransferase [Hoeflea sp.]MBU4530728.1 protein-L-isoaspartate O-methyltransferase [Alphaproteobacteria bacterium]MBU4544948.1 protein-L-isoaspartate O-methyltransferase [Alphaproteobacteria bacterium]MBU4552091.1 protein-L-isoaspartate O-methyltransferase [Alphaproteobacteria bacterium]MBV1722280.1 protein-L-isoaspartate O-methyltransferase [Hoeflea sp.]MBV1761842.1 protein-L-isoaspartate O-methyltransferase [Hoeflea sp.]
MGTDYQAARQKMVDNQIRTTDVTSHSVLKAFLTVAREDFVPTPLKPLAYIDTDLRISDVDGVGRYVMEPSPLAKMLQLAQITRDQVVLEIGCGSGYTAAILSLLAGSVVAVESDPALADQASELLSDTGYDNVAVVTSDLEKGYAAEGPYDLIFFNGAVEQVPAALFDQLREGGKLVAAIGSGLSAQAHLFVKDGGVVSGRPAFNISVKPLPGFRAVEAFVF